MNHTQHNSVTRLAELATRFAKLSLDMIEMTNSLLAEPLTANKAETPHLTAADPTPPTLTPELPQRKQASKEEVLASVKACREIIGNKNHPMQLSAIFPEIIARGFVINTPKPLATYAARLRAYRDDVGLLYLEGFGWWLAERPYAPANHVPTNVTRIGKHII